MFRFNNRLAFLGALSGVMLLLAAASDALTLLSPTPDQVVREKVKIVMPGSAVPSGGFVNLFVGPEGAQAFVAAFSRENGQDPIADKLKAAISHRREYIRVNVADYTKAEDVGKQKYKSLVDANAVENVKYDLTAGSEPARLILKKGGEPAILKSYFKPSNDILVFRRSVSMSPVEKAAVEITGLNELLNKYADLGVSTLTFYWDSKAPYRDQSNSTTDKFFKDGRYAIKVNIHDSQGKIVDTATVNVDLKNKVPRTNPAPAVPLVYRLSFGQIDTYAVHADVQVFQVVNAVSLPILGGLGMTSDFKVVQSVEDQRSNGEYLLRARVDEGARVGSFGKSRILYRSAANRPQLYRLITKHGNVTKANMFKKQARFAITDVLPILPRSPVKEGDTWPASMHLKVEGLTGAIAFTGTSSLDSFEWQDGHECAKIVSQLTGKGSISLSGGKVRSTGGDVTAQVTTFFAYRSGRALRSEIALEFPAVVEPGAGEYSEQEQSSESEESDYISPLPEDDENPLPTRSSVSRPARGYTASSSTPSEGFLRDGKVHLDIVIQLEK